MPIYETACNNPICGNRGVPVEHYRKTDRELRESAFSKQYNVYRKVAKEKGLEFSISLAEFCGFITRQCYYCGEKSSNLLHYRVKRRLVRFPYNGIDRFNNEKGYTAHNCVTCCKNCNWAKAKMSALEFYELCQRVAKRERWIFEERDSAKQLSVGMVW